MCLGFVISHAHHVYDLSCPVLACLGFVGSSVCLSRVCYGTHHYCNLWFMNIFKTFLINCCIINTINITLWFSLRVNSIIKIMKGYSDFTSVRSIYNNIFVLSFCDQGWRGRKRLLWKNCRSHTLLNFKPKKYNENKNNHIIRHILTQSNNIYKL